MMQDKRHYNDLFIDFDDTLCDTHGSADLALHDVFSEYELERWFPEQEVFYTHYWESNIDLWRRYGKGEISRDYLIVERFRYPLSKGMPQQEVTEQYCREMNDRFLELCVEKIYPLEGASELVDYLRQRGYRLHLCSNGFHEVQYRKLRNCGWEGSFDTVILSEDAGVNKPSRGYFDYAFKVSQGIPETTLMIGDGWDSDMRGALDYGLDTLYFNRFPDYPAPEPVKYEVHRLEDITRIL